MAKRRYTWPDGHWDWPIPVTHKHGVRCGEMIFFGGQVDLDSDGNVRNPGDLGKQTQATMEYIRIVLGEFEADVEDLVKLICFYVHTNEEDRTRLLDEVASALGDGPGPVISLIPLPGLAYEDMMVEIEGIAMRSVEGSRMPKFASTRAGGYAHLPKPLSHALRCGRMIFVGGQTTLTADDGIKHESDLVAQSHEVAEQIGNLLSEFGASYGDVVKINRYYVAGGTAEEWEGAALAVGSYFEEPGPAATGIPIPQLFRPGLMVSVEMTAMLGEEGEHLSREHTWPKGHWDWPAHLPYKHGIRCGNMVYVGGQVSMDPKGVILDRGDLVAQTRTCMKNIADVLAGFGLDLDDVVKVTAFYAGNASAELLHENLSIRSASFTEPGPASTGIPMPCLAYEKMEIEIEIVAMTD